jgi:hypothetical protein
LKAILPQSAVGGCTTSASTRSGNVPEVTSFDPRLRVQVVDDEIIVTLPQSHYSATYYKPEGARKLLAKNISDRDDPRVPMLVSKFLAKAWKLANDKARELGWDWPE